MVVLKYEQRGQGREHLKQILTHKSIHASLLCSINTDPQSLLYKSNSESVAFAYLFYMFAANTIWQQNLTYTDAKLSIVFISPTWHG